MRRAVTALMGLLLSLTFAPLLPASSEYLVRPGDTLYSISRRFDVSETAIRAANGISDPRALSIGQRLVIPGTYTVKRGDTYWSVARTFDMSVDDLLEMNDRTADSVLRVGDVLIVSSGDDADGAPAPDAPTAVADARTDAEEGRTAASESGRAAGSAVSRDGGSRDGATASEGKSAAETTDTASVGKSTEVAATNPPAAQTVLWPHPGDRNPVTGKFPGVAISASAGDVVYSVSAGRVIYSGPHTAFGRVVFVQTNDGYLYVYAGNSELAVTVGDRVRVGTPIGRVGSTPTAEEAQLYFSVWKNNRYVDPSEAPRG